MRPKTLDYTLVAADDNGYLDDVTGAGPWSTILAQPGDGCAHPVILTSAANLSAITITITGTDAEGRALTATIAGPNAGTVTTAEHFKTVVSVSASSTLGANTMDVGWTAVASTPTYPVDASSQGQAMVVADIGGTINYTLQQTSSNVFSGDTVHWGTLGTAGATADQVVNALVGATGLRATVASHTSGTVSLSFSQARN